MADQCVLEIDKSLFSACFTGFEQHDVFRVVIAEHGDAGRLAFEQRGERTLPRRAPPFAVHFEPHGRAVPFDEQVHLAQIDG